MHLNTAAWNVTHMRWAQFKNNSGCISEQACWSDMVKASECIIEQKPVQ